MPHRSPAHPPLPPPHFVSPRGVSQSACPCPAPSTAAVVPTLDGRPSLLLIQLVLQVPHTRHKTKRQVPGLMCGESTSWPMVGASGDLEPQACSMSNIHDYSVDQTLLFSRSCKHLLKRQVLVNNISSDAFY